MPSYRGARYAIGSGLVGALAAMVCPGGAAAQQSGLTGLAATEAALSRIAASSEIAFTPAVTREIEASVAIFTGNFCAPPGASVQTDICRQTIFREDVLERAIREYLNDAATNRPQRIESVGGKLARYGGQDLAMAGWPPTAENTLGVVVVPPELRGSTISARIGGGLQRLGRAGEKVLVYSGQSTLVFSAQSGSQLEYPITVAARALASINPGKSVAAGTGGAGAIEPPMSDFCYRPGFFERREELDAFNWGRATIAEPDDVKRQNLIPFAKQSGVDIHIVNDTSYSCDAQCQQGFGMAFARAIAVWRSGCERCDANALTIINVGSMTWLDSRVAGRLRKVIAHSSPAPVLNLTIKYGDEQQRQIAAPSISIPQTTLVSYDDVSNDRVMTSAVCALAPGDAPWVREAQTLLCGTRSGNSVQSATLWLKPAATQCGPAKDELACGLANRGIEITAEDSRYELETPSGKKFWPTATSGDLFDIQRVITHEVGHWFRVPHLQLTDRSLIDVMGEAYNSAACVSGPSMMLLNNAADMRWHPNQETKFGLRRRAAPAGGR